MIAPRHAQLAALKEAINTHIDALNRSMHYQKGSYGDTRRQAARAALNMDKALLQSILFDWQPMETMPRGATQDVYAVLEHKSNGSRFLASVWMDDAGTLFYADIESTNAVPLVFTAVAWSRAPESKALGGK